MFPLVFGMQAKTKQTNTHTKKKNIMPQISSLQFTVTIIADDVASENEVQGNFDHPSTKSAAKLILIIFCFIATEQSLNFKNAV